MRPQITLYGKAECCLCDDVRADLELLRGELEFELTEIDITSDGVLFERFRYLIPVVDIDGSDMLMPPHSIRRLRNAIAEAGERNG